MGYFSRGHPSQLNRVGSGVVWVTGLFSLCHGRSTSLRFVCLNVLGPFHQMIFIPWWQHKMGTFSALLALCAGNSLSPVNSPHKGQWHGALMFSLICDWTNGKSKQSRRRWFETRSCSLWRHCNAHFQRDENLILSYFIFWSSEQILRMPWQHRSHVSYTSYAKIIVIGWHKSAPAKFKSEQIELLKKFKFLWNTRLGNGSWPEYIKFKGSFLRPWLQKMAVFSGQWWHLDPLFT